MASAAGACGVAPRRCALAEFAAVAGVVVPGHVG